MSRMLLGETQKDLATAMKDWFSGDHYTVDIESNGLRILECLRQGHYDIVLIEMALPGLDAIQVVRGYRAFGGNAPIVLMASRHSSDELQCGLDSGADAFVVKPFQLSDLAAQLRALLRRPALRSARLLMSGGLSMDTGAGTLTRDDILIHLHPMEFKLLQFLLSHQNQVFNAQAILERVWQKDFEQLDDTVRTHIRTLRQKVDTAGSPSIITTVRGFGYKTESR
jgi:DNA-binding response OmpR family regulator